MTIYTHQNCMPITRVIDAATGHMVDHVVSIDTESQTLKQVPSPVKIIPTTGEFAELSRRFESVDIERDDVFDRPIRFVIHGLESLA